MIPLTDPIPSRGSHWKQRGHGPEADAVVLKIFDDSLYGTFILFRYINDGPRASVQCATLAIFQSLFYAENSPYPLEEPKSCAIPLPGNSSSKTHWLKRLFSFTESR